MPRNQPKPNGKVVRLRIRPEAIERLTHLAKAFGYLYAEDGSPSKMLDALAAGELVALPLRSLKYPIKPHELSGDKVQYKPTLYRESIQFLTELADSFGYYYADRGSISAFLEGVASNEVLLFRKETVFKTRVLVCKVM